jgi:hypothetical protein
LVFVKDFGWSVTTEIEVFVGIWLLLIAIYVYRKQVGEWYTRHSRWVDVWTIRILFSVGIAYGVYLFGKEFDWSLTTEIAVYVGFWLLLLTNILPEYDWWDRIFHRNNAERAERQMRTAGIWICGLAASAIVGGIVGSRFDETSSLYGGTIYWLWGTLAGLLTFACVRLWATSAKTK